MDATAANGAFERFLSSAIITIITILFSWRLLLEPSPQDQHQQENQQQQNSCSNENKPTTTTTEQGDSIMENSLSYMDTRDSIMDISRSSMEPHTYHQVAYNDDTWMVSDDSADGSSGGDDLTMHEDNYDEDSSEGEDQNMKLTSLQWQRLLMMQDDSSDSSVSDSEGVYCCGHLATITEEDTDDLASLVSLASLASSTGDSSNKSVHSRLLGTVCTVESASTADSTVQPVPAVQPCPVTQAIQPMPGVQSTPVIQSDSIYAVPATSTCAVQSDSISAAQVPTIPTCAVQPLRAVQQAPKLQARPRISPAQHPNSAEDLLPHIDISGSESDDVFLSSCSTPYALIHTPNPVIIGSYIDRQYENDRFKHNKIFRNKDLSTENRISEDASEDVVDSGENIFNFDVNTATDTHYMDAEAAKLSDKSSINGDKCDVNIDDNNMGELYESGTLVDKAIAGSVMPSTVSCDHEHSEDKLNLNFHPLEVVSRYRDPQLQVSENEDKLQHEPETESCDHEHNKDNLQHEPESVCMKDMPNKDNTLQSQKAVTAYSEGEQLLPYDLEEQDSVMNLTEHTKNQLHYNVSTKISDKNMPMTNDGENSSDKQSKNAITVYTQLQIQPFDPAEQPVVMTDGFLAELTRDQCHYDNNITNNRNNSDKNNAVITGGPTQLLSEVGEAGTGVSLAGGITQSIDSQHRAVTVDRPPGASREITRPAAGRSSASNARVSSASNASIAGLSSAVLNSVNSCETGHTAIAQVRGSADSAHGRMSSMSYIYQDSPLSSAVSPRPSRFTFTTTKVVREKYHFRYDDRAGKQLARTSGDAIDREVIRTPGNDPRNGNFTESGSGKTPRNDAGVFTLTYNDSKVCDASEMLPATYCDANSPEAPKPNFNDSFGQSYPHSDQVNTMSYDAPDSANKIQPGERQVWQSNPRSNLSTCTSNPSKTRETNRVLVPNTSRQRVATGASSAETRPSMANVQFAKGCHSSSDQPCDYSGRVPHSANPDCEAHAAGQTCYTGDANATFLPQELQESRQVRNDVCADATATASASNLYIAVARATARAATIAAASVAQGLSESSGDHPDGSLDNAGLLHGLVVSTSCVVKRDTLPDTHVSHYFQPPDNDSLTIRESIPEKYRSSPGYSGESPVIPDQLTEQVSPSPEIMEHPHNPKPLFPAKKGSSGHTKKKSGSLKKAPVKAVEVKKITPEDLIKGKKKLKKKKVAARPDPVSVASISSVEKSEQLLSSLPPAQNVSPPQDKISDQTMSKPETKFQIRINNEKTKTPKVTKLDFKPKDDDSTRAVQHEQPLYESQAISDRTDLKRNATSDGKASDEKDVRRKNVSTRETGNENTELSHAGATLAQCGANVGPASDQREIKGSSSKVYEVNDKVELGKSPQQPQAVKIKVKKINASKNKYLEPAGSDPRAGITEAGPEDQSRVAMAPDNSVNSVKSKPAKSTTNLLFMDTGNKKCNKTERNKSSDASVDIKNMKASGADGINKNSTVENSSKFVPSLESAVPSEEGNSDHSADNSKPQISSLRIQVEDRRTSPVFIESLLPANVHPPPSRNRINKARKHFFSSAEHIPYRSGDTRQQRSICNDPYSASANVRPNRQRVALVLVDIDIEAGQNKTVISKHNELRQRLRNARPQPPRPSYVDQVWNARELISTLSQERLNYLTQYGDTGYSPYNIGAGPADNVYLGTKSTPDLSCKRAVIYETDLDSVSPSITRSLNNFSKEISPFEFHEGDDADRSKSVGDVFVEDESPMCSDEADSGHQSTVRQQLSAFEIRIARSLCNLSLPDWCRYSQRLSQTIVPLEHAHPHFLYTNFRVWNTDVPKPSGRPVVIEHRVLKPSFLSVLRKPQLKNMTEDFELPSDKYRKQATVWKTVRTNPWNKQISEKVISEAKKRPAKEAYLQLKSQQEGNALGRRDLKGNALGRRDLESNALGGRDFKSQEDSNALGRRDLKGNALGRRDLESNVLGRRDFKIKDDQVEMNKPSVMAGRMEINEPDIKSSTHKKKLSFFNDSLLYETPITHIVYEVEDNKDSSNKLHQGEVDPCTPLSTRDNELKEKARTSEWQTDTLSDRYRMSPVQGGKVSEAVKSPVLSPVNHSQIMRPIESPVCEQSQPCPQLQSIVVNPQSSGARCTPHLSEPRRGQADNADNKPGESGNLGKATDMADSQVLTNKPVKDTSSTYHVITSGTSTPSHKPDALSPAPKVNKEKRVKKYKTKIVHTPKPVQMGVVTTAKPAPAKPEGRKQTTVKSPGDVHVHFNPVVTKSEPSSTSVSSVVDTKPVYVSGIEHTPARTDSQVTVPAIVASDYFIPVNEANGRPSVQSVQHEYPKKTTDPAIKSEYPKKTIDYASEYTPRNISADIITVPTRPTTLLRQDNQAQPGNGVTPVSWPPLAGAGHGFVPAVDKSPLENEQKTGKHKLKKKNQRKKHIEQHTPLTSPQTDIGPLVAQTSLDEVLGGLLALPSSGPGRVSPVSSVSTTSLFQNVTYDLGVMNNELPKDNIVRRLLEASSYVPETSPSTTPSSPLSASSERVTMHKDSRDRLSEEVIIIKCRYQKCGRSALLSEARKSYKTCHNCYTYYCSRVCRKTHWERHKRSCLFSRVNSVCKHVVKKVHDEEELSREMTRVARTGFLQQGRGSVVLFFSSPDGAKDFIQGGTQQLDSPPVYLSLQDLEHIQHNAASEHWFTLHDMCKNYNPEVKFVLNTCIIAGDVVQAHPVPRREGPVVQKCAKLRLSEPQGRRKVQSDERDTLVLTAVPGAEFTENMDGRKAREVCFVSIQRRLRQRGVSLRHHYPEVYQQLCGYVADNTPFTPITLFPLDSSTGRRFMCLIMPNSEPDVEWMNQPDILENIGLGTTSTEV